MLHIAIVGRPNVGKSSLFNRLAQKKRAIVADMPGVTRDRIEAVGKLGELSFHITDTGGITNGLDELTTEVVKQVDWAISSADLILLVVDGKGGLIGEDNLIAKKVLKSGKPTILVINKCEGNTNYSDEFYRLGFDNIVAISTAHNLGMYELHQAIEPFFYESVEVENSDVKITIVGRPNAGKSTLLNQILGEERAITGSLAGLTRESLEVPFSYNGYKLNLVDTAGIRRRKFINDKLEVLSVEDSFKAIEYSEVIILLVDASIGLDQHELSLINKIIEEGRSLVIAINKWDLIEDKNVYFQQMQHHLSQVLPQIAGVPLIYISAKYGTKIDKLLDSCIEVYKIWNIRISTGKLNEWLRKALETHPLPLSSSKKRLRIKYITQYKARPPTFKLFCNLPDQINNSYVRYLISSLREHFDLHAVPIRFFLAKSDNPYT